ncbi:hypothetical protein SAY86_013965 [Trapa natans]|uniref:Uncharacterized protein n=1 Tax=Trapa natans TaxID=22666 RepID=A0AAN7QQY7_TRANT|nr:hypothetical protein SAY86_013965 [Trapa natans]
MMLYAYIYHQGLLWAGTFFILRPFTISLLTAYAIKQEREREHHQPRGMHMVAIGSPYLIPQLRSMHLHRFLETECESRRVALFQPSGLKTQRFSWCSKINAVSGSQPHMES